MAKRPDNHQQIGKNALTPQSDQIQVEHVAAGDTQITPVAASNPVAAGDLLTFHRLAAVPPEMEWFANITNANTRRAYKRDVEDFASFVGLSRPEDMRLVTRAHVIAWRNLLGQKNLADSTIRRKLAAISTLFAYLTDNNAIEANPASGVKRPISRIKEGASPALSAPNKLVFFWTHLIPIPSKANATGRCSPPSSFMACAAPSSARSRSAIVSSAKEQPICVSRARATRSAICRPALKPSSALKTIS